MQDGRRNPKEMKSASKLDSELKKLKGMQVDRGGHSVDLSRFDGAFSESSSAAAPEATPSRKRPRIRGV